MVIEERKRPRAMEEENKEHDETQKVPAQPLNFKKKNKGKN